MSFVKFLSFILTYTFVLMLSAQELGVEQTAVPYQSSNSYYFHKHKKHAKRHYPYVSQKNYQNFWDKGTFPTVQDSINYHTKKHGYERSQLQYTRDAVNFYERNKRLRYSTTLKDGSPGYRIRKGQ